jgi:hypothetical protein
MSGIEGDLLVIAGDELIADEVAEELLGFTVVGTVTGLVCVAT